MANMGTIMCSFNVTCFALFCIFSVDMNSGQEFTNAMKWIINLYGKTWHFWEVDAGHEFPMGYPHLMGSVTRADQVDLDEAMAKRNGLFSVHHAHKADARKSIKEPTTSESLLLWRRRTRLGHVKGFRELLIQHSRLTRARPLRPSYLNIRPCFAATPPAITTTIRTARLIAQGQETIRVEIVFSNCDPNHEYQYGDNKDKRHEVAGNAIGNFLNSRLRQFGLIDHDPNGFNSIFA
ncbi:hypothetical protein M430DRAFT_58512 [Amorphotheca resinae ATCC 22711]|uniref:Uncharacterized protein n=1 Tax=Amorphotheca resinae ATCC 22711 TaxID=857342 RepID=A0A2T3B133_AMORE|nr:hypothetical protein M430DRAFT_58512 [Amorphotheca resinae ATCC 22711]PSS18274.1 hypothetical protein M430DRAFT_58512 [Amorphotheca resinae ATCC 22711]